MTTVIQTVYTSKKTWLQNKMQFAQRQEAVDYVYKKMQNYVPFNLVYESGDPVTINGITYTIDTCLDKFQLLKEGEHSYVNILFEIVGA